VLKAAFGDGRSVGQSPVEVYANGHLIARGEVVVTTGDKVGVSITEIVKSIFTT